jgi:hypothetical protein
VPWSVDRVVGNVLLRRDSTWSIVPVECAVALYRLGAILVGNVLPCGGLNCNVAKNQGVGALVRHDAIWIDAVVVHRRDATCSIDPVECAAALYRLGAIFVGNVLFRGGLNCNVARIDGYGALVCRDAIWIDIVH